MRRFALGLTTFALATSSLAQDHFRGELVRIEGP